MNCPARQRWKKAYRAFRVWRRETNKAYADELINGRGLLELPTDPDQDVRHIPWAEVIGAVA